MEIPIHLPCSLQVGYLRSVVISLVGIITFGSFSACGGPSGNLGFGVNPNVVVTISPKPTGVPQGTSFAFNVMVTGDSSDKGVTWTLTPANGAGALTNISPFAVTYNAPATAPFPGALVSVIANSVSYGFNGDTAGFVVTIPGLTTTITNKITTISPGGASVNLNAAVANDPHSAGVNWFITGPNANCQGPTPGCGTLSNETPFSVVYTPPTAVPSSPNNTPYIQANSISDPTEYDRNSFTIQ
jgi:hypothetical protein